MLIQANELPTRLITIYGEIYIHEREYKNKYLVFSFLHQSPSVIFLMECWGRLAETDTPTVCLHDLTSPFACPKINCLSRAPGSASAHPTTPGCAAARCEKVQLLVSASGLLYST
ncbi:hypothetical protein EVAR_82263_1 [Eumeta japonica]|uniref:Uncharacterized protein n=1 Tax=Eumeta variegata TaxID=151549 RepID=A0A4C1VYE4_EUMVA|nr:hypothetical protein EVAR_82263_1 [Eumeta japonica]